MYFVGNYTVGNYHKFNPWKNTNEVSEVKPTTETKEDDTLIVSRDHILKIKTQILQLISCMTFLSLYQLS